MPKKNKKPNFVIEIIFLIIGIILGGALLITNIYVPFLNEQVFIGLIILVSLCSATLIAMGVLKRKWTRGDDN